MTMFYAFFALCLVHCALAGPCKTRQCCPNLETPKDFDTSRYTGRWYTQLAVRPTEEDKEKCYIMEYDLDENDELTLSSSKIFPNDIRTFNNETTHVPNSDEPSKLKDSTGANYWILGTDHDNYAVTYGCEESDCMVFATILTREVNPSESVINEAIEVAEKNNLHASMFYKNEPLLCEKAFVESRVTECEEDEQKEEQKEEPEEESKGNKCFLGFWC